MSKIKTDITFAGQPIEVEKLDGDIAIYCKNLKGYLSQVKTWNQKSSPIKQYFFGDKRILMNQNGKIQIECLTGEDISEQLIKFCSKLKD